MGIGAAEIAGEQMLLLRQGDASEDENGGGRVAAGAADGEFAAFEKDMRVGVWGLQPEVALCEILPIPN